MTSVEIQRSALVACPPEQLFDLVDDVEGYAARFKWCLEGSVLERSDEQRLARLRVRVAGLELTFTTRNRVLRPDYIELEGVQGPFRSLNGRWTFVRLGTEGCKVALALSFDPDNRLMAPALRVGFRALVDRLVDDFVAAVRS